MNANDADIRNIKELIALGEVVINIVAKKLPNFNRCDIASITWLELMITLDRIKKGKEISNILRYLVTVVTNAVLRLSLNHREVEFNEENVDGHVANPDLFDICDKVHAAQVMGVIREILEGYSQRNRMIFELRWLEGKDFLTIADELGMTEINARVTCNRILKRIQKDPRFQAIC